MTTPASHTPSGAAHAAAPDGVVAPQVTVAVCQLAPVLGDLAGNVRRAVAAVSDAAARGARIVVLPELVTTGYVFASAEEARDLAEPAGGRSVAAFQVEAARHDLVVVGGFAELGSDGAVYNSAFVVDPTGVRAVYRKVHLWDQEARWFRPGDQPPPLVDTQYGRVTTLVCYDLEFPEWTRTAALTGADLICAPTNWPSSPRPAGERPAEVVRLQATASVERVFIAACDRVGVERGTAWVGGSAIVGPDGYPLALADGTDTAQTLLATCELAQARDKSTSAVNDVVRDRRPELYGRVARTRPEGTA